MMILGKWDYLYSLFFFDRGLRWYNKIFKGVLLFNRVYFLWRYYYDKKIKMFDFVYIFIIICIGLEFLIKCKKKIVLL